MLYDTDYKRAKPPKNHVLVTIEIWSHKFNSLIKMEMIYHAYPQIEMIYQA